MAADWIKMRCELQSHPKIVRILSATSSDKFRVIGGLHAVWSVFDAHSVDGSLHGYTPALMDHIIGWEGFSGAMVDAGWLLFDGEKTLTLPEFAEHNGQSAKRRAEDAKRKRYGRSSEERPQNVRKMSDQKADAVWSREREREDKEKICATASRFDEFWSAYPNKTGRKPCLGKWKSRRLDEHADAIIADVKARASNDRRWLDGFVPNPETYLNQDRWLDPIQPRAGSSSDIPDFLIGAI